MYDPSKPCNDLINKQIQRTWKTKHMVVFNEYHYKKFFNYSWHTDHTDGIGTKGQFHWQHRTFHEAVLDALAMNINDLQMCKAKPYKLQNHIMLPIEDKEAIAEIITKMADECVCRDITITGGECAIHDDMRGLEISITMSGYVDRNCDLESIERELPINNFKLGDILVGLPSSGLHSNGFTLVRKMMQTHGSEKLPFRKTWLTPTTIYNINDYTSWINGIQHITGGAFLKLKKRLSDLDIIIHRSHNLNPQNEFEELYKCEFSNELMYKNFNCGIGMILSVDPNYLNCIMGNIGGEIIGEVKKGSGLVIIESKFNKLTFVL